MRMARNLTFVGGRGVVDPRAPAETKPAPAPREDTLSRQAHELVHRYVARGLSGDALLEAIDRHERILRAGDPDVASELRRKHRTLARIAYAEAG